VVPGITNEDFAPNYGKSSRIPEITKGTALSTGLPDQFPKRIEFQNAVIELIA
jgi:hypothetical protein